MKVSYISAIPSRIRADHLLHGRQVLGRSDVVFLLCLVESGRTGGHGISGAQETTGDGTPSVPSHFRTRVHVAFRYCRYTERMSVVKM